MPTPRHERTQQEVGRGEKVQNLLATADVALLVHGDLATSRPLYERAARSALADDDPVALARAALGLGGLWVHEHRTAVVASRVEAWQQRALKQLEQDSPLAARPEIRLAAESDYRQGQSERVLAALARARSAGDPEVLGDALNLAHHCLLGPDDRDVRLELAQELLHVAALTGRPIDEQLGLLWRTVDLLLAGHPHAERSLAELRSTADRGSLRAVQYVVAAMEVMLSIRAGAFGEAEALAERCLHEGQEVGDADALGWYVGQLVAVRWFQGRLGELLPELLARAHSTSLAGPDDSLFAGVVLAAAVAGDPQSAVGALQRLRHGGLGRLPKTSTWLVSMAGLAEAAHRLADGELAREVYELLQPYSELPAMASLGIVDFGSVHHHLGTAALVFGDVGVAIRHLERSASANAALGHLPALALTRERLAEAANASARTTPAGGDVTCRRQGRGWRLEWASRSVSVGDIVGMRYLAALLACPGQEIAAVDLAGRSRAGQTAQPLLDERARQSYQRRVRELQVAIAEAEAQGDLGQLAYAREEYEWLLVELERATGLAGRDRGFADQGERARTSVRKALQRAVAMVRDADPEIASELESHLVTGFQCCYRPSAEVRGAR